MGRTSTAEATMAAGALRGAVKAIAGVVEKRSTIPILTSLRLVASGKQMVVEATDLDIWASATVDLAEPSRLHTTLSAQTLAAIMNEVTAGDVSLSLEEGATRLTMTAGRSFYELPVLPPEEWPMPINGPADAEFEVAGGDLASLFGTVSYAISTEETRYYLNGVFLHVHADRLTAAATDGHRVVETSMPLPEGASVMPAVIVPRKTVALILKLAARAVEPVTVAVSGRRVRFDFDGMAIDSKTIDGDFPDYRRVIPTNNGNVAEVDPGTLLGAIKRVSAITTDKTRSVKLACSKAGINVQTASVENGSAREFIDAGYVGEGLSIGFNRQYLIDIVGRAGAEPLDIAMADAAAPVLIRDRSRPDVVQVLMPMRV